MQELENALYQDLSKIIEQGKRQVTAQVNSTLTMVYWQVGERINTEILHNERAEYGKEIVATLARQLKFTFGNSFQEKNLRRMMQFAEEFEEFEIVAPLVRQLSWTHFTILIPIKDKAKRLFYAKQAAEESWSKRELIRQIERKAFERKEIAQLQLTDTPNELQTSFKDPYFLDFLGLKEGYLENDLEGAILKELEHFILELGKGFAFVERQKRMTIDSEDFYLDLLFYHRKLKRLVAIELKLGKFKAAHKGQMELYLKWLDKHEKQEGENPPIGLILCAEKSTEQVELLEMGKDGILVAEYWTDLPPKEKLEAKLHQSLIEAKARIDQKKLLDS
ncbi:MAG: PDDEXK nuclease domain-containing protein [Salibacteraceae bacterium]|nr:PDDEXK nuclease domain-containing protein [Salibacteraceae bacterium]